MADIVQDWEYPEDDKKNHKLDIYDLNSLIDYCFDYFKQQEDTLEDFKLLKSEINYMDSFTPIETVVEKLAEKLLNQNTIIDNNHYKFMRIMEYYMKLKNSDYDINPECAQCGSRNTCNKLFLERLEVMKG